MRRGALAPLTLPVSTLTQTKTRATLTVASTTPTCEQCTVINVRDSTTSGVSKARADRILALPIFPRGVRQQQAKQRRRKRILTRKNCEAAATTGTLAVG